MFWVRPLSMKEVVVTVPISVPSRRTRYPATEMLSVDGDHESAAVVDDVALPLTP